MRPILAHRRPLAPLWRTGRPAPLRPRRQRWQGPADGAPRRLEAWLATSAELPVNLRLVLDGEEEIGSPTLAAGTRSSI